MRNAARRRGDLGGTLDQVRAALDQALAQERDTLAGEEGDDARWAEMELATLPDDTAGAVRALRAYDWHSREARATYESIQEMLQREVLDAQFAGLKQALDDPDPAAMQAVKDMLADLNGLLAAHARGEDTEDRFRDFMDKHGDLFPEKPEDVDELIDALARRQAAADRMMASLSPEQREQLGQLMSDAMSDPDLASQMAQLSDNLRALRPGHRPRSGRACAGAASRWATATPSRRSPSSPTWRRWSSPWRRGTRGRRWTTSTWRPSRSTSVPARRPTSRRCASWSASWSGRASCPGATTGCG